MGWTDDAVARLKELFTANELSTSGIAAELNKEFPDLRASRNAVIGKLHRLGLRRPGEVRRIRATQRAMRPRRPPQPVKPPRQMVHGNGFAPPTDEQLDYARQSFALAKQDANVRAPDEKRISLFDLTSCNCHWPLGEPYESTFAFCGAPATGTYCPYHSVVATRGSWYAQSLVPPSTSV